MPENVKNRPGDQPLPTPGGECVQDALIAAIEERKALGIERYRRPLETFNGRNALQDAKEELIDGAVYLQQVEMEWDAMRRAYLAVQAVLDSACGEIEPGSAAEHGYIIAMDQVRRAMDPKATASLTDLEHTTREAVRRAVVDGPMSADDWVESIFRLVGAPLIALAESLQEQLRGAMREAA